MKMKADVFPENHFSKTRSHMRFSVLVRLRDLHACANSDGSSEPSVIT